MCIYIYINKMIPTSGHKQSWGMKITEGQNKQILQPKGDNGSARKVVEKHSLKPREATRAHGRPWDATRGYVRPREATGGHGRPREATGGNRDHFPRTDLGAPRGSSPRPTPPGPLKLRLLGINDLIKRYIYIYLYICNDSGECSRRSLVNDNNGGAKRSCFLFFLFCRPQETNDHGRLWELTGAHGRPRETTGDHGRPRDHKLADESI